MKFNRQVRIQNIEISDQSKVFIIAEGGVNHNGDMGIAKQLVDIAKEAGADAVKFQTFKTEHLILKNVDKALYQKRNAPMNSQYAMDSQYDMLKQLEISQEINCMLKKYCDEKDIIFLTTPFDDISLTELDMINLPAYKIASTDTTNIPFY
ncbi:MAG: hypothetical protein OMM_08006 [Candidatus Magnetoglobus multicellularis str. Araruama]|uniref:PseI/NeuA/B-like domain-containing protein n=1 Tax=Candidatus Magnetoglobus multicellularis str. Araruama TaxID=890399 RepID=A0A1V1PA77_9BACT|nr:MAG: hypothetical protein OMM_08006 [Candidatus Magnetoglobus multicellularis str. Araruama]